MHKLVPRLRQRTLKPGKEAHEVVCRFKSSRDTVVPIGKFTSTVL